MSAYGNRAQGPLGMRIPVTFTVNGNLHRLEVEAHHSLLDVLRNQLHLSGSKECCSVGECGACTVMLDGRSVDSCLIFCAEVDGHTITTIEGLERNGDLDTVQKAFIGEGAVQCGFCIPGMIMSAYCLLKHNPAPNTREIQEGLAGNLCRCAGYSRIIQAVRTAARTERHE